jgi:hypothetical protein
MTAAGNDPPTVADVLAKLGEAATTLGAYVTHTVDDHPAVAVGAALAAGFVLGGGLLSPLGARVVSATARATAGNVATMIALDLVRRALEDGASRGSPEGAATR